MTQHKVHIEQWSLYYNLRIDVRNFHNKDINLRPNVVLWCVKVMCIESMSEIIITDTN